MASLQNIWRGAFFMLSTKPSHRLRLFNSFPLTSVSKMRKPYTTADKSNAGIMVSQLTFLTPFFLILYKSGIPFVYIRVNGNIHDTTSPKNWDIAISSRDLYYVAPSAVPLRNGTWV